MDMLIFCYRNIRKQSREQTNKLIVRSVKKYCDQKHKACHPGELKVLRTGLGKPYLENSDLHIGVTHTKDVVMIGVSATPFGIDAEAAARDIKHRNQIVKRFFTPEEQEEIFSKPLSLQNRYFLHLWVKKEAFLKYQGIGLSELSKADIARLDGGFTEVAYEDLIAYIYSPVPVTYRCIEHDSDESGAE